MAPLEFLPIALLALGFEAAAGYPDLLFRRIGHPVTWMGALIGLLDRTLNRDDLDDDRRRMNGVLAAVVNVLVSIAAATLLAALFGLAGPIAGLGLAAIAGSTLIAARSLHVHVAAVADGMRRGGLAEGRIAMKQALDILLNRPLKEE